MNRLSLSICLVFALFAASSSAQMTTSNAEHLIKGCVQSHNGAYVLGTKKGHQIALMGADVSAHVGHEVVLKGEWVGQHENPSTYSGPTADAQRESPFESKGTRTNTFKVSRVKKVSSESCKDKGYKDLISSPSGPSPNSTRPPQ